MICLASVSRFWLDGCPEVRVFASWLSEFGFSPDTKVVVDVTKGQIVIKVVDVEDMGSVEAGNEEVAEL